jgi:hypothetical protein
MVELLMIPEKIKEMLRESFGKVGRLITSVEGQVISMRVGRDFAGA